MAEHRRRDRWKDSSVLLCGIFYLCLSCVFVDIVTSQRAHKASIQKLPQDTGCTDLSGSPKGHLDRWTLSGCDDIVCFHGTLANFTITYDCRPIRDEEVPDPQHCYRQSTPTLAFPACCPVLVCDERAVNNWTDATQPPCYDRSAALSCSFWISEGGCDPANEYYSITEYYCQQACGFC